MEYDQEAEVRKYQQRFWDIRPIFAEHLPKLSDMQITGVIHEYLACYDGGLGELWNYDRVQEKLSSARDYLEKAAKNLRDIPPLVVGEIELNLSLPIDVLNGKHDRRNCSEDVFDGAPSIEEVENAISVLRNLVKFQSNLDLAIKYTQNELPKGIPIQVRNVEAWTIVEAALEVLKKRPNGINIPKSINGCGPLRALLLDLFKHHRCTGTVDSTFNEWRKKLDTKRESFEMLPMD